MHYDIADSVNSRYARMLEAHPDLLKIADEAKRIEHANMRFPLKAARFYELADRLKTLQEPFVVCKSGCNYCCHMPTMAFQHEAEAMAVASGRLARKLEYRPIAVAVSMTLAFSEQPCPFLTGGQCSIYAHRPLVCRLHNSLNDDPLDCKMTPGGTIRPVASIDFDIIEMPYIRAVLRWNQREPYGAIQEYFPPD